MSKAIDPRFLPRKTGNYPFVLKPAYPEKGLWNPAFLDKLPENRRNLPPDDSYKLRKEFPLDTALERAGYRRAR